jgi:predicted nucleotidyltransferase
MRLNSKQIVSITETAAEVAGVGARVWLFGSRLDDARTGGDVDLLIESKPAIGLMGRAKIKLFLEQKLNLPVDVISSEFNETQKAFVLIAKANSFCLNDLVLS